MSNQGLQAHYPATQQSLLRRTEQIMRSLKENNTSASGEPSAPKLEVKVQNRGNSLKVNWIKQDDGGSPIKHYLVRYKAKHTSHWKPEIRLPNGSEYVVLSGLDWNTEYEIHVVAENQQGKSEPGILSFRTAIEPTTIPATLGCRCVTYSLAALLLSMLTVHWLS
ncbi:neural cell adhesion molecule 1-like isoform X11 [Lates japonicus]|uniref:Neural cell adhesion molecule 1-like isoform X11 n=1 Tax=Lates japonicus TaxID=270547 RepID=A0AAD3M2H1_LATJO|nr:neural cell adhesion molecule 1-like isoform X11 [Lates japonicus]